MDSIQFIIFCVGVFGLFIWNRTETRADIRHMDAKLESNRNLSITIHKETQEMIRAIEKEIKDFHGRLERQDAEFKAHLMYEHKTKNNAT
jgi:hypothetical protein